MFNRVGGYSSNDFPAEDLSLWIRLSEISTLVSVPEILFSYRISKSSTSGSRQKEVKAKKIEIIDNWIIEKNRLLAFDKNLDLTKLEYRQTPNSKLRTIFLYRNLMKYHKKILSPGLKQLSLRAHFYLLILLAPVTSIQAFYYFLRRRQSRNL